MELVIDSPLDDAEIIDRLGTTAIAEAFGISSGAVRHWRKRGIPDDRRGELLALLAEQTETKAIPGDTTPIHPRIAPPIADTTEDLSLIHI